MIQTFLVREIGRGRCVEEHSLEMTKVLWGGGGGDNSRTEIAEFNGVAVICDMIYNSINPTYI